MFGDGIIRSTDDGLTWTQIVPTGTTYQAFAVNSTKIFAADFTGMNSGNLDGSNFISMSTGMANANPVLAMTRGINDRIIAVGQNDLAITTVDNGLIWQVANNGIAPGVTELNRVASSPIADVWLAAKQVSVRYTADAGVNWSTQQTGLNLAGNEPILGAFCDSSQTFYIYNYSGIYKLDAATVVEEIERPLAIAYPNPASTMVLLPEQFTNTEVELLDINGRVVKVEQIVDGGVLDVSEVPDGHYLVRATNITGMIKVVVQH